MVHIPPQRKGNSLQLQFLLEKSVHDMNTGVWGSVEYILKMCIAFHFDEDCNLFYIYIWYASSHYFSLERQNKGKRGRANRVTVNHEMVLANHCQSNKLHNFKDITFCNDMMSFQ